MESFDDILLRAEKRKGGKAALKRLLRPVPPLKGLSSVGDDRCLAMMTKVINQAGFRWSVIEKKWPQFEEAYFNFDPKKLSYLSPDQWDAYSRDTRIVRHGQKIQAVIDNVIFVLDTAREYGSFGQFLAQWPVDDQVGLMLYLKKHGSRLGGNTGQRFLRYIGRDAFILTGDVVLALQHDDVDIADTPTSQRDLKKAQQRFNDWHQETGLPYTHLSQIAAYSIGVNYQ